MYKVNTELTKELYEKYHLKEFIEKNSCYSNVYHISNVWGLSKQFTENKYKIALCYTCIETLPIWMRHCVIVSEQNEILDFSLYNSSLPLERRQYKIFKVFETYIDYIDTIEDNLDGDGYRCDFPNLKEEYDFCIAEKKKDAFFNINEHDFYEYVIPLHKKYGEV